MMICMLVVRKIKVTSVLAGWAEPQDARGKCGKTDGDEEETRRFRRCQMMEKESRQGGKEGGKRWCFIHLKTSISHRPVSVIAGSGFMESRPLNSASNIIYKKAL